MVLEEFYIMDTLRFGCTFPIFLILVSYSSLVGWFFNKEQ